MAHQKTIPPSYELDSFTCPHCGFTSPQTWHVLFCVEELRGRPRYAVPAGTIHIPSELEAQAIEAAMQMSDPLKDFRASKCGHCKLVMIWHDQGAVYPEYSPVSEPDEDMPEDVKKLYREAASVMKRSPAAAAVIIRVALQTLLPHISETKPSGALMADIGALVSQGFDAEVVQASDLVRLLGDEGAHPDKIMLGQTFKDASALFFLLSHIADQAYERKRARERIKQMSAAIPAAKQAHIDDRNRGYAPKSPRGGGQSGQPA